MGSESWSGSAENRQVNNNWLLPPTHPANLLMSRRLKGNASDVWETKGLWILTISGLSVRVTVEQMTDSIPGRAASGLEIIELRITVGLPSNAGDPEKHGGAFIGDSLLGGSTGDEGIHASKILLANGAVGETSDFAKKVILAGGAGAKGTVLVA